MPAKPGSARPKRQYGHIKESLRKQGKSDALAEEIAAQTVDRRRAPRLEVDSVARDGSQPPVAAHEEAPRRKR